ncbi:hypothetical protein [Siphonobacter sp. SORGH_AS_0500]
MRNHLDLKIRVKRLTRHVICFCKSSFMYAMVSGIAINYRFFESI